MGLFGVYGANHKLYGEIKSLLPNNSRYFNREDSKPYRDLE